jgi:hypothetical protein
MCQMHVLCVLAVGACARVRLYAPICHPSVIPCCLSYLSLHIYAIHPIRNRESNPRRAAPAVPTGLLSRADTHDTSVHVTRLCHPHRATIGPQPNGQYRYQ